jgi:transcriptional regulator with XRE-family HTH domain
MDDDGELLGVRLRQIRRRKSLTQEQLAERAAVSVDVIRKLEQGRRGSARASTIVALANALDVELSALVGKRPRLDDGVDARVLPLRDALLAPDLLPGLQVTPTADPPAVEHVRADVSDAWADYWAGRFSRLAARLPGLVADTRATQEAFGLAAVPLVAQAYQLVACLLVHLGKDDLAVIGAERALRSAEGGEDELQWATLHGTFAWALLHQGRAAAAVEHAMRIAERVEPSLTRSTLPHLSVWGGLVLTAMAAAAVEGRPDLVADHLGLARSAAGRFTAERTDYQVTFGPAQVAAQTTHAYAVLHEPTEALRAAAGIRPDDLPPVAYGRHLIDRAQASLDAADLAATERSLLDAQALSAEWFRHQGPARALVAELVHEAQRLSPPLQQLASALGE